MKEITKEQRANLLLYATYTILYMNDMACFSIQQLGKEVMARDKESKKIYGALLKRCKHYINDLESRINRAIDAWCDYCTNMDDICDESYNEYKVEIFNTYKKANVDDCSYLANVEAMRSMVELAVQGGKHIIEDVCIYIPDATWLKDCLIADMMRVANNFANWSYRRVPENIKIDLNEESDVMKKFNTFSSLLIDYDSFVKSHNNFGL